MARRSSALRLDDVSALPGACGSCLLWERFADGAQLPLGTPPGRPARWGGGGEEAQAAKRAWWSERLATGTGGGVVLRLGNQNGSTGASGRLAGYVTYAVPAKSDGDALTVLGLHVDEPCRAAGLGRALVHAVAREALRRPGVRAVEALAARGLAGAGNGDGAAVRPAHPGSCLVPLEFWLACGFTVVREHPLSPRVRLDTRVLAGWRTEVEGAFELAWERLRGAVRPDPAPGPATEALRVRRG